MSVQATTCYTLSCDSCGQTCNPADEGEIHFYDVEQARRDMLDYEWSHTEGRDLCRECTAADQCAKLGHVPALDMGGKYCDRCEEPL